MKFFVVCAVLVAAATATDYSSWTLTELGDAIQDPKTDRADLLDLEQAFNERMDSIFNEPNEDAVDVPSTRLELSHWTLQELSDALQNPATNPDLKPYLKNALKKIMDALFSGIQVDFAVVIAPVGLAPTKPQAVENTVEPISLRNVTQVQGPSVTSALKPTHPPCHGDEDESEDA